MRPTGLLTATQTKAFQPDMLAPAAQVLSMGLIALHALNIAGLGETANPRVDFLKNGTGNI
jgi:hypothetical protein